MCLLQTERARRSSAIAQNNTFSARINSASTIFLFAMAIRTVTMVPTRSNAMCVAATSSSARLMANAYQGKTHPDS